MRFFFPDPFFFQVGREPGKHLSSSRVPVWDITLKVSRISMAFLRGKKMGLCPKRAGLNIKPGSGARCRGSPARQRPRGAWLRAAGLSRRREPRARPGGGGRFSPRPPGRRRVTAAAGARPGACAGGERHRLPPGQCLCSQAN